MEVKHHTVTITIYDRHKVYDTVGKILHNYSENVQLRVGYPVPDQDISVIFLITKMTNDEAGALSGKLGQISSVKVRTTTLNV